MNKPGTKTEILQRRLNKVNRLAELMREDHNVEKAIQAYRLINLINARLTDRTRLKMPHIN